jgi:Ca2+-binding EF-hand superfamily protein
LAAEFKAPKEGEHVCWRDFVDRVDEVFTKKGLEKDLTIKVEDVRT